MKIEILSEGKSYSVTVEAGILNRAENCLPVYEKTLILTDTGVPQEYIGMLSGKVRQPYIYRIASGEGQKTLDTVQNLLTFMLRQGFSRSDCLICAGGGMVGDLGGFTASCYMRGIDFYNIPTTLLSAVDASVGGKTAVNLAGAKNTVGAFYPPKAVLIDTDILAKLPKRLLAEGLSESIKMAAASDEELFRVFEESSDIVKRLEEIVSRSVLLKKAVTEKDPLEKGYRKILNFGHTIGHAVEAASCGALLHGECVAIGMLPMCEDAVRNHLENVLKKYSLPTGNPFSAEQLKPYLRYDKKKNAEKITAVLLPEIGKAVLQDMTEEEISKRIRS